MGIENMRRWPMYVVFAACILLTLSLLNSWSLETELRNKINEISRQLQECSKQQTSCMEDSLSLLEQKEGHVSKINQLERQKQDLNNNIEKYRKKISDTEVQVNGTLVDMDMCKTELQSLKNLQESQSAALDTFRLEKKTMDAQLQERKQKIEDLEQDIAKLKLSLTSKSAVNSPVSPKVTPAAPPPKLSPIFNVIQEPVVDNDAKEESDDIRVDPAQREADDDQPIL